MRLTPGAKRIAALRSPSAFSRELDMLTGIKTRPNGSRYLDMSEERLLTHDTHSWAEIGEAVCGRDIMQRLRDKRMGGMRGGRWTATEDAGDGAMGPSQFQAINYWSETVARVLEALQLEKFQQVDFIGDKITTLKPGVVMNVGRRPRYSPPTVKPKSLQPNEPIPMGSMDAEWIDVNPLEKHGQGLAISTETVLFDGNQGAAVGAVGDVAYQIGWSKEDRILMPVFGMQNTYRYGAADSAGDSTAFNTYYAVGDAQQYVNKTTVELADEVSLDTVEQLFLGMKHPRTNLPINVTSTRDLIVTPAKLMVARRLSRITTIEQGARTTAPAAVEATATTWAGYRPANGCPTPSTCPPTASTSCLTGWPARTRAG